MRLSGALLSVSLVAAGLLLAAGCGSTSEDHAIGADRDADAGAVVLLDGSANQDGGDSAPADGSPPGPRLADDEMLFISNSAIPGDTCNGKGPDFNIEVMRIDGTGRRALASPKDVNTADDEYWPRLSPDRTRFLFYRLTVGRTSEICRYKLEELWIANIDGSGARKIFSNEARNAIATAHGWDLATTYQGHADWSPDGRHVVMVLGYAPELFVPLLAAGEAQLFVLDVDTGELRQATNRKDSSGHGQTADPSYSADGSEILFIGCPDSQPAGCSVSEIRTIPADAQNATSSTLVHTPSAVGANDVYMSPKGDQLLWIDPANPLAAKPPRLMVAPFKKGAAIATADVVQHGTAFYGNWSRDGSRIIFHDGWSIYSTPSASGSTPVPVTPQGSSEAFAFASP